MKNILVPIDFSSETQYVLKKAEELAARFECKLWLVHVTTSSIEKMSFTLGVEKFPGLGIAGGGYSNFIRYDVVRDQIAAELRAEHNKLLKIKDEVDSSINSRAILIQGDIVECILREAKEVEADLIVMGSHGHGRLHKAILGSTSEAIMADGNYPVLIVPASKE